VDKHNLLDFNSQKLASLKLLDTLKIDADSGKYRFFLQRK
jgi:hypothetical protein